jgi:hypothetical protein
MAVTLFDPQPVIARIRDQVPALKRVAGAADFAAAAPDAKQLPAAFVVALSDRAGPNRLAVQATEQLMDARFGVIVAAQNLRDPRGEQAAVELRALRAAVAGALLGWTPDGETLEPIEFAAGRMLQLDNLVLWWQDDYTTRLLLRSI